MPKHSPSPNQFAPQGGANRAEPDPIIPAEISNKLRRKTSLYLTEADKKVLAKLMQLTGLRQSQIVGTGLRALLREIEHSPTLPAQQKITPTPRGGVEQIVEELKTLTHPLVS